MIKDDTFQKTETILKNYNRIKKSLSLLNEKLNALKKEQIKLKPIIVKSDKVVLKDNDKNYYYTDETLDNDINELTQLIIKTKAEIDFVDKCLLEISDDEYYKIIDLWYFKGRQQGYSREKIAEIFDCDPDTITRNRIRLVHKLKFLLFSKTSLSELIE